MREQIVPKFVLTIYWAMRIHANIRCVQLLSSLLNLVKSFSTLNLANFLIYDWGCIRDLLGFLYMKICFFYMCFELHIA